MATPRSACTSAGASFTPSPTMATDRPRACSSRIFSDFWSGSTSAKYSEIPSSLDTDSATPRASPVSITERIPNRVNSAMASLDSGRTISASAKSARAWPSRSSTTTVFPADSSCPSRSWVMALPWRARWPGLTMRTRTSPTTATMPSPVMLLTSLALGRAMPRRLASATMPWAIGCSDWLSAAAAKASSWLSSPSCSNTMSVTPKRPSVRVPVLSNTTASSRRARSNAARSRISKPLLALSDVLTATTNGTASPSACGQATTMTVTMRSMAKLSGASSISHQTSSVPTPTAKAM